MRLSGCSTRVCVDYFCATSCRLGKNAEGAYHCKGLTSCETASAAESSHSSWYAVMRHPLCPPQSLNRNVVQPLRSIRGFHGRRKLPVMRHLASTAPGVGAFTTEAHAHLRCTLQGATIDITWLYVYSIITRFGDVVDRNTQQLFYP